MKKLITLFFVFSLVIAAGLNAQTFTTNGTGGGNWSAATTWTGGVVPTGAGTMTIASTDSIMFDVTVSITGTLIKQSTKKDSIGASGNLTFANGSTYQHAVNGGAIPKATWSTGSTCTLTGLAGSIPSNIAQNFYNLTVNSPSYSGNLNFGWQNATVTIGGTLTVTNTAYTHSSTTTPTTQLRLFGGNGKCIINNILINGYAAHLTSVGSAYVDTIIVPGNITVSSGGAFSIANNSSAAVVFILQGNLAILDSGWVGKSNSANTSKILFAGTGIQTLTIPAGTWSTGPFLSAPNFEVASGSTLSFPGIKDTLSGSGSFIVDAGATIVCNHPLGINGIVRNSGTNGGGNSIAAGANVVFSGSSAQVTGTLMPATIRTVTVNNVAGVTSSQSLTITDTLFNTLGTLSGPYTATVTKTGGTGVQISGNFKPEEFGLDQNYPNPFNPTTKINYNIPKDSYVSLKVFNLIGQEVATLFSGMQSGGKYTVPFDASRLSSGVYIYRLQAGTSVEVKRMIFMK